MRTQNNLFGEHEHFRGMRFSIQTESETTKSERVYRGEQGEYGGQQKERLEFNINTINLLKDVCFNYTNKSKQFAVNAFTWL